MTNQVLLNNFLQAFDTWTQVPGLRGVEFDLMLEARAQLDNDLHTHAVLLSITPETNMPVELSNLIGVVAARLKDDPQIAEALARMHIIANDQNYQRAALGAINLIAVCQDCGCSTFNPCLNGCAWVATDLCSNCD
jgi:hypothetical protein